MKKERQNSEKAPIKDMAAIIFALVGVCGLIVCLVVMQKMQTKEQQFLQQNGEQKEEERIRTEQKKTAEDLIVINEVCSEGWIELYNPGSVKVELSGDYVMVNGEKDVILSDITISADGYISVELSKKMAYDGTDVIALCSKNDENIDRLLVPEIEANSSYGRTKDGDLAFQCMRPSKEVTNDGAERLETDGPSFSVPGGFYTDEITVELAAGEGDKIYYTLDGSTPTRESEEYTGALTIGNISGNDNVLAAKTDISAWTLYVPTEDVDKATIVRAISVDKNGNVSQVVTQSYYIYIGEKAAYQNMPVLSVVTDADNLFDYFDGIYVLGREHEDALAAGVSANNKANYYQGKKKEAYIQFYDADHILSYASDADVSIYLDESVNYTQKSMRFETKGNRAGNGSALGNYLFQNDARQFIISNGRVDYITKQRQSAVNTLFKDSGNLLLEEEPCIVFINGEFWGVYLLQTDFDREYVAKKTGGSSDNIITAVNGVVQEGEEYQNLLDSLYQYVLSHDMSDDSNYQEVLNKMNVQSYLDFICSHIYLADGGDTIDEYMWCKPGSSADGKWNWSMGRFDHTLAVSQTSTFTIDTYLRPAIHDNEFLNRLLQNDKFRQQFSKTMQQMEEKYFASGMIEKAVPAVTEPCKKAVVNTYKRFAGAMDETGYDSEIEKISEFLEYRGSYIEIYTEEILKKEK